MAVKKYSAVVEFGGVVAGSMRSATKIAKGDLSGVAASYQTIADKQSLLKKYAGFDMKSLSASKRAMIETRKEVDRLGAEMEAAGRPSAKLTKQFAAAQKKADRAKKAYRKQSDTLASLNHKLKKAGVNTKDLEGEFDRLAKSVSKSKRKLDALNNMKAANLKGNLKGVVSEAGKVSAVVTGAVMATGGAVFALADNVATLGDQTAKTADKLGIGVERLQEMRYAAERSGVDSGALDVSLQRMTRRLAEAAKGGGSAAGALRELGLDARELSDMKPDQAMAAIADAMKEVPNQSDRVRLAFKLFDSGGVGLVNMLKDGSQGLQQLYGDAKRVGWVLGEKASRDAEFFKDALLDAQTTVVGMKNIVGAELMPVVTDVMKEFTGSIGANQGAVKAWAKEFAGSVKEHLPKVLEFGRGVVTVVTTVVGALNTLAGAVGGYENLAYGFVAFMGLKTVVSIGKFATSLYSAGTAIAPLVSTALPGLAAGIKATTVAMMSNPIVAIIGGAVLAVTRLIYKWDELKKSFASGGVVGALKTYFGFGDDEEEQKQRAVKKPRGVTASYVQAPVSTAYQPVPDMPTPPPVGGHNVKVSQRIGDIHIQTQPGQDPEAIAEAVHRRLQEERQDALDRALYDPMTAGA